MASRESSHKQTHSVKAAAPCMRGERDHFLTAGSGAAFPRALRSGDVRLETLGGDLISGVLTANRNCTKVNSKTE